MRLCRLLIAALLLVGARGLGAEPPPKGLKPPTGKDLKALVERYLAADPVQRRTIRTEVDGAYAPLAAEALPSLRRELLAAARKIGPKLEFSGTHTLLPGEKGKYIAGGKPGGVLLIALHGGGAGAGEAESAAGSMGGGGWFWLYPEVIQKTEHGWTDSGTEEFVMALIDAAKRSGKVDPDRVYITGHSMGGYGTWTLGAHHADVFGGAAAYAGAPSPIWDPQEKTKVIAVEEGVLPAYFALPLFVFQSLDDKNVPPAANIFANQALKDWEQRFPGGWNRRYVEVDGRGHAPPAEGYMPSLEWITSFKRVARPARFLWQPVLPWKRQQHWLHWDNADMRALIEAVSGPGNEVEIKTHEGSHDVTGLSVLLGAPLVDPAKEVVVRVDGKEAYRGVPARLLSTLLMTLPRVDDGLFFDARVDL